tara:strand:- start:129 stop:527 length:399 start_codon:yes stop_codon:yes gene_type:complete
MSENFKLEIVNPEKSFLDREDINQVVVPGYEGEIGILKDHISIISFLKPGIIKVFSNNAEEKYYVEDGILEFKENTLSILTSYIKSLKDIDAKFIDKSIKEAEEEINKEDIIDQKKFLLSQKIDILSSISVN